MGNKKFITMLERQIDLFVGTFQDDADDFFKDDHKGKLIHPGEYGMYRERCFKALLQNVLSREEKVSDGFIITSVNDTISTQCDVLVRNANSVPLTDNGIVNFFPVEDVYAIIEVKSNLSKADFEKSLLKLAKNKMLSNHRRCVEKLNDSDFMDIYFIPSFLVCNKLEFDIKTIDFEKIYGNIDRGFWHNAILSINDGALGYALYYSELPVETKQYYEKGKFDVINGACAHHNPLRLFIKENGEVERYFCRDNWVKKKESDKYQHIIFFLCALKQAVEKMIRYRFDGLVYLDMNNDELWADYKNLYKNLPI